MKIKVAVYAGTFDPPTIGHEWMIREAAKMFDELIVAIGVNPDKRTMFDLTTRRAMLVEMTRHIPNVRVALFENQYLIRYAEEVGATFIVRGIRNSNDYEYERAMRHVNGDLGGDITTIFLMPPREFSEVSSSVVKGLIGPVGWEVVVAKYISSTVLEKLKQKKSGGDL